MIVLGVAPGLSELAYSVLACYPDAVLVDPIDADVLHGGRGGPPASVIALQRRTHVHHMILGLVFERHTPALVVLGPASKTNEPDEHVNGVRMLLRVIAEGVRVPVIELPDKLDMIAALGADQRSWRRSVDDRLREPISHDRRIVLATATALAGLNTFRRRSALTGDYPAC